MGFRVVIADDDKEARRWLRGLLEAEPDVAVVEEASNGTDAIRLIESERPDLVFLDVEMPGADGFEIVEAIGAEPLPAVIFVTAFDHFALQAFDARALDYLLKPFNRSRFQQALDRVRVQLRQKRERNLESQLESLLSHLEKPKYLDRVAIRSGLKTMFLPTHEIDWMESEANYVRLHAGKKSYLIRDSMGGMVAKLDPEHFVQIHRARIVNINRIESLQTVSATEWIVVLRDGTKLSASRGYRDQLRQRLGAA